MAVEEIQLYLRGRSRPKIEPCLYTLQFLWMRQKIKQKLKELPVTVPEVRSIGHKDPKWLKQSRENEKCQTVEITCC